MDRRRKSNVMGDDMLGILPPIHNSYKDKYSNKY